jgi:hypothetical protein
MSDLVGFTRKSAERVARSTVRDERRYNNAEASRARYPSGPGNPGLRPARLGGAGIAAGGLAATSAAGTLLNVSGSTLSGTGGTAVTLYNPFGVAFGANKFCWVTWYGVWFLVSVEC